MTTELIALIVGFVVSVLVEVVPGLREIWSEWKWRRASLLGLFVTVPLGAWLLSCQAGLTIPGTYLCTAQGILNAVVTGLVAYAGSQATYLMATRQSPNAKLRHLYQHH